MLHRRTNTDTTNARPSLASPLPAISTPPKQNTAYRPLRRPSQTLYATPQSGAKPRYSLPSPSPGLTVNTAGHGLGGNGYGFGGAYDLTPDYGTGSSSKSGPIDYIGNVRGVLDRLRRGLEDACRIDKSLTMVFGYASFQQQEWPRLMVGTGNYGHWFSNQRWCWREDDSFYADKPE